MHCFIVSEKNYDEQTLAQQSEIEKEVWLLSGSNIMNLLRRIC